MLDAPAPRLAVLAAALLALAALAACNATNPNFCEGSTCGDPDAGPDGRPQACTASGADPACPPDNPICTSGVCGGACTDDSTCSARTDGDTVCLSSSGDCVACNESNVQAATPGSAEDDCPSATMAVCDGTSHTCRACAEHSECASGVCDAGTCVAAMDVVYMRTDGADGNACGDAPASACLTMQAAIDRLTGNKKYIVMAPSPGAFYLTKAGTGNRADFNNHVAHVIGYGAFLRRSNDGVIVDVNGSSANVIIEGLTIEHATGATGSGVTNSSRLELRRATVRNNDRVGVESTAGSIRIVRSSIVANQSGGVVVSDGTFTLTNNFIVLNGGPQAPFGGVSIGTTSTGNVFDFNTIASNASSNLATDGVICMAGAHAVRNNIIVGSATKPRVAPGSTCTFTNTLYGPDGTIGGASNQLVANLADLMFLSATDFHIAAGTVATGKASATSLTADTSIDYDGDRREPGGATVEVGADEIP